jgi:putative ABC transport system permease protein
VLRTTLAGLRAHLLRLLLTALAITLGVGFVSGTFVLTDTMQAGFDQQFTASADKVSVAVLRKSGTAHHDTGDQTDTGLPASLLTRLKGLPGVQDAHGQVRGDAPLLGKDGRAYGDVPTLGLSIPTGALQRYRLKSGHLPGTSGEVVLDGTVAKRTGFKVGDTVKVLDRKDTARTFTVTGLMDFGVDQEIGFRGAVGFTPNAATEMTGKRGFVEIDLKAAPGTTNEQLRDAVATAAGGSYDVLTSDQLVKRLVASSSGMDAAQIGLFFLAFAIVALFVAALVIYNTFNILIAQRMREMALLRCVGATRSQVFRGVLVESLVVGFAASVLGVLAGIGLGTGGAALLASAANSSLGPVAVSPTPVIVGLVAGMAVTLLSALLPARAATRVAPIAALRRQTEGPVRGRAGIVRILIGAVAGLGGLALAGLAMAAKAGEGPFMMVLAGAMLIFLAVIALSPLIVRGLSGLVGWLPARFMGVPGRLARENARRNPKRAAITTIALTVGVTLMTMFSVALASAQSTTEASLAKQFPVDYQLSTQIGSDRLIPRQVAADLRARPQFAEVTEMQEATGRLSGRELDIGSLDGQSLGRSIKPPLVAGSLADLKPGTVALQVDLAKSLGVGVGGELSLGGRTGAIPLKVAAVFTGDTPMPGVTITGSDFQHAFGVKNDKTIYVLDKKGVSADDSRRVIDEVTKAYPMVKVGSAADVKAQFTKAINQLFVLVGALLGLAIVISLIGIANTLTLSVVERTRESALLRALGLTKRGLRRMLSIEAVIMAVIGALIGVVLGTAFGWAALRATVDGALLSFPALRVIAFVLVAALAGMLAAVLPGRRAARTSIVESLAAE